MKFIADLHIHSPYSRATSKTSHLFGLASWAAVKGLHVVGTGDFTHPVWFKQLLENLEEAEPGFYRLKQEREASFENILPEGLAVNTKNIRFVLTTEISSIYKRGGKVRKIHNIIFSPDLDSARKLNATLAGIGNIESDGRPILGLDSRDLLEIVLEKIPEGFIVPAHIWTPWFSLFGSKSGFDSIEECFGDLSDHIFALETGLSSDPDMNRHISALDRFTLISNSDCHSPGKLGREANIFDTGFDFFSMKKAMQSPVDEAGHQVFDSTIEFYPEEGKYHCDGHRKCGICLEPFETEKINSICPECGRPVTVGVLNRVMELADRSKPVYPVGSPKVHSLVPLAEILSELLGVGPATKKVTQAYVSLIRQFGSEFEILLNTPKSDLGANASPVLAEAIQRVRSGNVIRKPGFDGEFGVISVFEEGERSNIAGQLNLFGISPSKSKKYKQQKITGLKKKTTEAVKKKALTIKKLNPEQIRAVESDARHIIVKAGPGTGKTHTLVQRVIRLAQKTNSPCTVITFTNKTADELLQRITESLGESAPVTISTLHGYCLRWLRHENPAIRVAGPEMRTRIVSNVYKTTKKDTKNIEKQVAEFLNGAPDLTSGYPENLEKYFHALEQENQIDIDAVVPGVIALLKSAGATAAEMRERTGSLFIDEFQDLNQSQYELVMFLAETSHVFAIGDPDQSIYGFRGSDPVWFSRFIEALDPEQHVLFRNYRSGSRIVDAAHVVIQCNEQRVISLSPKSETMRNGEIFINRLTSPRAEALFILRQVESLIGGSSHRVIDILQSQNDHEVTLSDIVILYRTSRQAEVITDAFARHGLPFQVVDIRPFYCSGPAEYLYLWSLAASLKAETDDVIALLKLEKTAKPSELAILEQSMPLGMQYPLASLAELQSVCPKSQFTLLKQLEEFAAELRETADKGLDAALLKIIQRYNLDVEDPDIVRFFHVAENFKCSFDKLTEHLKRYNDSVVYDDRTEAVTLMTIHAAKGLEFPVVFLVGAEEGVLPLSLKNNISGSNKENLHIEEERRLFYVGMTRAEKLLFLSHVENRQVGKEVIKQKQSRFIKEIPVSLYSEGDKNVYPLIKKSTARQLSLF